VLPAAVGTSGAQAYVGGVTAAFIDIGDRISSRLPYFIGAVVLLSFLLLMLVFHSILVPLTAAVMNLLSVAAAYGATVAVFQGGWAKGLVGLESTVPIVPFVPMMMFAVLFGLSMDYQVFLLSRIRERYDQNDDSRESVAYGIGSTAKLITGAALIMVAVFAGFAAGQLVMFQQMGFGLGVAILIDATLVRTILMPAWMELLGDRSWYLPHFLAWLPDLRVESTSGSAPATSAGD
jgi:RND superfamily putative drug exporter